jgi:hypothetical protein
LKFDLRLVQRDPISKNPLLLKILADESSVFPENQNRRISLRLPAAGENMLVTAVMVLADTSGETSQKQKGYENSDFPFFPFSSTASA